MNLHSGLPYWLVSNGLLADYPSLTEDLPDEEVVIIGSGISGALVAHELCNAGFRCCMLDRRILSCGSTVASTAHLNYEIDIYLYKLAEKYGEDAAVRIYQSNIEAVKNVGEILRVAGVDAGYEQKSSLYLATDKKGLKEIETEYQMRRKHGIAVELLNNSDLKSEYGVDRMNALWHPHAAQMDPYRASTGLISQHVATGALRVFTRTEVVKLLSEVNGVSLETATGLTIRAAHVVCASGYESLTFLPRRVMKISSTYALVTQPIAEDMLWSKQPLIWETARPYFYLRTTKDRRIMMGGLDVPFKNEKLRDALLDKKVERLLQKCTELFPQLKTLNPDFSWCGSFAETEDDLPHIGEYPGMKNISFALGYGGNGITFSMIAAEIIRNKLSGQRDERASLFAFDRK